MMLKFPPPLVFACCAILVGALANTPESHFIQRLLAVIIGVCSLVVSLLALSCFRQAHTTLNPRYPTQTSALVTTGIYRISRNPMYFALVGFLVAESLWLNALFGFVVVWGFIHFITRFQIMPEEQALAEKFGERYQHYKKHVPRWLW